MEHPEKNIDWDKLLQQLDRLPEGDAYAFPEDSEEARNLRMAQEMRRRLLSSAPDEKFPDGEGWERFHETIRREDSAKRRTRILYWTSAAAAAVILAMAGVRFFRKEAAPVINGEIAQLAPSGKVEIKTSNGKVISLRDSILQLQLNNDATVSTANGEIVYEGAGSDAITTDTLVVPRGNRIRISLADGTKVWLNADSRLVYPSRFGPGRREVAVKGEAYFDVAADAARPFIVKAGGMDVEVLGTQFNLNTYSGAIYATLTQGKVRTAAAGGSVILNPGEQAVLPAGGSYPEKRAADVRTVTAWKDGQLYFEEITLGDITTTLGRDYDYTFRFEDESLRQLIFTLDMPRPVSLKAVLDQINRTTGDIQYRIENRTVYLNRE